MSATPGGEYNVIHNGTVCWVVGPDGKPVEWQEVLKILNLSLRPEVECRVARWCPKPKPDEQCIRCNRFADRQSQPQKEGE